MSIPDSTMFCTYSSIQDLSGIKYFKNVKRLYCSNNSLTTLPALPSGLTYLDCSYNQITNLTSLPVGLDHLECEINQLTTLPVLPGTLSYFDCSSNLLTGLQNLPAAITDFNCSNNLYLSCLPTNSFTNLNSFYISNTGINCLPDTFTAINYDIDPYYMPICSGPCSSSAGYVSIPDTNFGSWLSANGYSSCLRGDNTSGWLLDTMCSQLFADTIADCHYLNITNLTGIQYLKGLHQLDCSENSLSTLPPLPAGLTTLNCSDNVITSITSLPAGLTFINCKGNRLTNMTSVFSLAGINYVDCSSNRLTGLPALPSRLTNLICTYNQLTTLPAMPAALTELECGNNQLVSLPGLPTGLTYLGCEFNQLIGLPALPVGLTTFTCAYNQITSLPSLPPLLYYLNCSNNQLINIPPLNVNIGVSPMPVLNTFDCSYNQLISIPYIPQSITNFNCSYNPTLSCLPVFDPQPSNLQYIYFAGTQINCLRQTFSISVTSDMPISSMSLCPGGCDLYYITGNVHQDTANTCTDDSLNPGMPIDNIKVQLMNNGVVQQQYYTLSSGIYLFKADSMNNYTVFIDTTGLPLSIVCPSSDSQYVSFTTADTVVSGINFGMSCSQNDYAVQYIEASHFRPTDITNVNISAGNQARLRYHVPCMAGSAGTVTTSLIGAVSYIGPAAGALTPTSVSGNTLTYTAADLDSLTAGSLDIVVMTDSTAAIGASVCISTVITPASPDINPGDDTLVQCFTIVASWDPNSKIVSPTDTFVANQWLNYTLEFQNTGSDTARTIVILDTLSQNVDASTFQFLASDHKAVIQLSGNVVSFTFPKINLVDSITNPQLSTGWVQYKVKTKANLPLLTEVKNTAYIYFDNNPAVVTNTTSNTLDTLTHTSTLVNTGIASIDGNKIRLYPNPNQGSFTLQTLGQISGSYTVRDMVGNMISRQKITTPSQVINLPGIDDGVYTIEVEGADPLRFTIVR